MSALLELYKFVEMSGKCFNERNRHSIWANEWNQNPDYEDQSVFSDTTLDEQNSSGISDVKQRMRKLYETQCYTDVTFYPKGNRKMSISAHRAVLAVGSPLFTRMLFGKDSELGMKMEVEISNIAFNAFTNIIRYIYTDEISFEDESLVQSTLDGAKQFGIVSLESKCKQYFANVELKNENVCQKLNMSVANKVEVLKERCIEFIQRNTLAVIQCPDFLKCSQSTLRVICKLQSLNLRSEVELFEAIMRWHNAQPQQNRTTLLEPLLKSVRFLNFTVTELGDTLKKYPAIMSADDGLSIMLFLYNPSRSPNFSSLPSWINKNATSRCFLKDENPDADLLGPSVEDPKGGAGGTVSFPLKPDPGQGFVPQLTSLLQMKCVSGFHVLKAITLTFERPLTERCCIGCLTINVHVHPSDFRTFEKIQVVRSEIVRVEFKKTIKVRRGDMVDIEAEARSIVSYKFLQYDETGPMPANHHFTSSISSVPKIGKLYFISEIEYGPQDINTVNKGGKRRNPRLR